MPTQRSIFSKLHWYQTLLKINIMYSCIYPIRLLQPSQLRSAEGMVYLDACKYSISRLSLHHIKNSPEFSVNNPNSSVLWEIFSNWFSYRQANKDREITPYCIRCFKTNANMFMINRVHPTNICFVSFSETSLTDSLPFYF